MQKKHLYLKFLAFVIAILTVLPVSTDHIKLNAQGATPSPTPIAPGTVVKDYAGFEMVYVPEGTFQMGITPDAFRKLYTEQFQTDPEAQLQIMGEAGIFDTYQATLGAFWIDRYEVTIEQYTPYMSQCIGSGECSKIDLSAYPGLTDDQKKPQVDVTWFDALKFCSIRDARLPTEEEWEYAASGPHHFVFPWGNTIESDAVAFGKSTWPVGSKPKNKSWVGAYDMVGNAAQWVEDRFKPYKINSTWWPQGVGSEVARVIRGGAWDGWFETATTYTRNYGNPYEQDKTHGFRCARSSHP